MRVSAVAVVSLLAACGGGGGSTTPDAAIAGGDALATSDAGRADALLPDAATLASSHTLKIHARFEVNVSATAPSYGTATVTVTGLDDAPITDATVTVGENGNAVTMKANDPSPGTHSGSWSGSARRYTLDVRRGGDFFEGFAMLGQFEVAVALTPDPPRIGAGVTLSWDKPEPAASAAIIVYAPSGDSHVVGPIADDGSEALPATFFADSGNYRFSLARTNRFDLDVAGAFVEASLVQRLERAVAP